MIVRTFTQETITDIWMNSLGRRYLACILVLWMFHGANAKDVYPLDSGTQAFVCFTNAASKVMVTFLCEWTGQ